MKPNKKVGAATLRDRRAFTAEFNADAVQLMAVQRADTLAPVGREAP